MKHAGAVIALLLTVLVVAGCQSDGRRFQTTLGTSRQIPLPISLIDETQLVAGIGEKTIDPATWNDPAPAVHELPGDPTAVALAWLGGACDHDATVRFHVVHGDYLLNLAVHQDAGIGCPAGGGPRAGRIELPRATPADSIVAAGG